MAPQRFLLVLATLSATALLSAGFVANSGSGAGDGTTPESIVGSWFVVADPDFGLSPKFGLLVTFTGSKNIIESSMGMSLFLERIPQTEGSVPGLDRARALTGQGSWETRPAENVFGATWLSFLTDSSGVFLSQAVRFVVDLTVAGDEFEGRFQVDLLLNPADPDSGITLGRGVLFGTRIRPEPPIR